MPPLETQDEYLLAQIKETDLLQTLLLNSIGPAGLLDTELRLRACNEAFAQLIGADHPPLGQPIAGYFPGLKDWLAEHQAALERAEWPEAAPTYQFSHQAQPTAPSQSFQAWLHPFASLAGGTEGMVVQLQKAAGAGDLYQRISKLEKAAQDRKGPGRHQPTIPLAGTAHL